MLLSTEEVEVEVVRLSVAAAAATAAAVAALKREGEGLEGEGLEGEGEAAYVQVQAMAGAVVRDSTLWEVQTSGNTVLPSHMEAQEGTRPQVTTRHLSTTVQGV